MIKAPNEVGLEITETCNLHCIYCYCSRRTVNSESRSALSTADWRAVINDLGQWGVRNITLAGGEPTLHPDIVAIVDAVTEAGMECSIDTNGTTTAIIANSILTTLAVKASIYLSVDSFDPAVYRFHTGVDIDMVLDGIASYVKAGAAVFGVQVVTRANYCEANRVIEEAIRRGMKGMLFIKGSSCVGRPDDWEITCEEFKQHYIVMPPPRSKVS